MGMKKILPHIFLVCLLLVVGCAPTVQRTPEEQAAFDRQIAEQKVRQERIRKVRAYQMILRAECYSRDNQLRLNRLQQGANLCLIKGLTPDEFGEIERMRVVVQQSFANRQPLIDSEDFLPSDQVWSGNKVGVLRPILMPDSLTGAVVSTALGLSKGTVTIAGEAAFSWLKLPPGTFSAAVQNSKLAPFLDPEGNLKSAGSRFGNLGTRPNSVSVTVTLCSDIGCYLAETLSLETR